VSNVVVPAASDDAVSGLFFDSVMQVSMFHDLALQRGSAQLFKQVGESVLRNFSGKRVLLSVAGSIFTDTSPPIPAPAPPYPALLPEQELLSYWREIPWGRFYECAAISCPYELSNHPAGATSDDCVATVRNMQMEALAGIPIAFNDAYSYSYDFARKWVVGGKSVDLGVENTFRLSLAMFLMGAERHSRFGYGNGYVCITDPLEADKHSSNLPPQFGTATSCTWLWRPEWDRPLGPPKSWARQSGLLFTREFEHLDVALDCSTMTTNFTWKSDDTASKLTWRNSTTGIHSFLTFDSHAKPASIAAYGSRIDFVWGSTGEQRLSEWRRANPEAVLSSYIPFSRDPNPKPHISGKGANATTLPWWQKNKPELVLYRCDRRTPAWSAHEYTAMPLDLTNPSTLEFQMQQGVLPAKAASYNAIALGTIT